jgi:uncharacterized membrane protein (GlpM family)
MLVRFKLAALKETKIREYLIRFALGGFTTVVAGLVAAYGGPALGGLMLAFPAIFCASATLIEKHERTNKQGKGLQGARRGKEAAALDAAGAAWGSIAMAAFAVAVYLLAGGSPALCLVAACLVWLAIAVALFFARRKFRRTGL